MSIVEGVVDEPAGRGTALSLRGTGFTLLWLNAVSYQLIGAADRFTFVWLVDETLDAAAWASGFVVFMLGAPVVLFVLIAGAMADRGDRRRQLLASQVAGMVVTAATAILVGTGVMNVALAAVMAFAFGLAFAFAQPVRMSLIPILVGRERLQRAVVVMTIGSNLATIVGPVMVGGVITRWGVAWALGMQSVLFAVGFVLAWPLRVPPRDPTLPPPMPISRSRLVAEVREGLSFVWGDARLRWLFFLLGIGGAVMTGSAYLLLPKLAADEFGRSADDAAALFAFMGVGMVTTSLLLLRRIQLRRRGLVFIIATCAAAMVEIAQGLAPTYLALAVALLAWGGHGWLLHQPQPRADPGDHAHRAARPRGVVAAAQHLRAGAHRGAHRRVHGLGDRHPRDDRDVRRRRRRARIAGARPGDRATRSTLIRRGDGR
jgi:MFS family permease